jgi:ABC-type multidrug transport system permease subunit
LFGGVTAYLGYFTLESLGWMILALVLVWAATSSMGFMISTYLFKSSPMVLNNLANLLGIGFIFIPPVYFSEAQLGSLSWVSIIVPTSNVAGLMRSYMGLLSLSTETVMIRWAVLILMSVAFIVLTSMKSRWRET